MSHTIFDRLRVCASIGLVLLLLEGCESPTARNQRIPRDRGGSTEPLTVEESLGATFVDDWEGASTWATYALCNPAAAPILRRALEIDSIGRAHGNVLAMLGWVGDQRDVETCREVLQGVYVPKGAFSLVS